MEIKEEKRITPKRSLSFIIKREAQLFVGERVSLLWL